ncbi:NAD(P)/FAD-dependent oxidoreductase [Candidatus Micrarchaeota archaeon]|nr:NAD(P)/FAD-dependent oxidoreductase [Candidatus Micrarchaeota archaeon]
MRLMERYDAVVVGAGPAGSTFAKIAAEGGMEVLLLDKKKEIGSPVRCGEGIGDAWVSRVWPQGIPSACIGARISGAIVFAPNGKSLCIRASHTTGFVLERKIFDKYLAVEAAKAGAHVLARTMATSLIKEDGRFTGMRLKHMEEEFEVKTDLIVSAEGMEARIAREAGFQSLATLYDVDTCVEYEMADLPCEDLIELYFGSIAPRGYAWVFPKGNQLANVGIGVGGLTGANPKKLLDSFIEKNERFRKAEVIEVKGGVISVGEPVKEKVKDNLMVIGTAAHLVDPTHGGGIGLAMESGIIAGRVAVKAFQKKDFSKKHLMHYEMAWDAREGNKLEKRLLLRKVLEKLNDDDYSNIIGEISADDLQKVLDGNYKSVVAKVLLKHPSLLKVLSALL